MSYIFKVNLSNRSNYGSERSLSSIKYIAIHYTANDGDTDEGNGKYFKNNIVKASAHYFVDSNSVTQSVPDNFVAWSVGGNKYKSCSTTGGGTLYGICNNANSISIEICDDNKNNVIRPSEATIVNTLELTKELMKKYNIPLSNVVRHFDVTGKLCPAYWSGDSVKNNLWITEFKNRIGKISNTVQAPSINNTTTSTSNVETYKVVAGDNLIKIGNKLGISWTTIAKLNNISSPYNIRPNQILKVKVTNTNTSSTTGEFKVKLKANLNIRETPNGKIIKSGGAKKGITYTIIKTNGSWGLLKSYKKKENGWISISSEYVTRV